MSPETPMAICHALDQVVARHGGSEAIVDSTSRLTYAELDDASRRLATLLRARGVARGDRVALLTVPSCVHAVAWFAVQRLGAIPVVLHLRESTEHLAALCEKFEVTALLFNAHLEPTATAVEKRTVRPVTTVPLTSGVPAGVAGEVDVPDGLAAHSPWSQQAGQDADDLAVIILSSGTTALPKGIMHSHRTVLAAVTAMADLYDGLGPTQRVLAPYSTAFTGSYVTWLPTLLTGGCCVFLEQFDLAALLEAVRRERVTLVSLGPTMWRMLLAMDDSPVTYRDVEFANFASEPMDTTTLRRIREIVTPRVIQLYGSTETFGLVTRNLAQDMGGPRLNSVGQRFPHGEFRVVEMKGGSDDPVPVGTQGVVMASSSSVAIGVWGDPTLSAELLPVDGDGRRWWRSSDLGEVDDEGFLYLHGRADDMIISGGINILPSAIEEALLSHPNVVEAAVVGLPDARWGQRVTAFIVARDDTLTPEELQDFLRGTALAGYQLPKQISFVTTLPRTATNKLNRRLLREDHTTPVVDLESLSSVKEQP